MALPLGKLMAAKLPRRIYQLPFGFTFCPNPGPFNLKEHMLIYVFSSTSSTPAYSLYNIIGQKYLLGQNISLIWCLIFGVVTQTFGLLGEFNT